MKVLVVMPHYVPVSRPRHEVEGSSRDGRAARAATVSTCIGQWNSLLNGRHFRLGTRHDVDPAPNASIEEVRTDIAGDVCLCMDAENHLASELKAVSFRAAQQGQADPRLLGYFCRSVLLDFKNEYDLFIYVEDDTAAWDPLFIQTIRNFYDRFGEDLLVLPNRYDLFTGFSYKCYLECPLPNDYRIPPPVGCRPSLTLPEGATFAVKDSPYAGFFAVTRAQLDAWERTPSFRHPSAGRATNALEQAMVPMAGARPVYRPSRSHMDHLEVHHLPNRASHARTPWRKLLSLTGHEAAGL